MLNGDLLNDVLDRLSNLPFLVDRLAESALEVELLGLRDAQGEEVVGYLSFRLDDLADLLVEEGALGLVAFFD